LITKWEEKVVDLTLEFEAKSAEFLQVYVSNSAAASRYVCVCVCVFGRAFGVSWCIVLLCALPTA
jgi:hypothetical protein